jgi:hypothetical protein
LQEAGCVTLEEMEEVFRSPCSCNIAILSPALAYSHRVSVAVELDELVWYVHVGFKVDLSPVLV